MIQSISPEFQAWMELHWPFVLLAIFIICMFLLGMFAVVIWMLRRADEHTVIALTNAHEEHERRNEELLERLVGEMSSKTNEIVGAVTDRADELLEEVDERQAERVSTMIGDRDG